jgi:tetratricopeptide (TPR) repeat protein
MIVVAVSRINASRDWVEVDETLEYRVHLVGPGNVAQTHSATGTSWQAPEGLLKPGERWTWSVEAVTPEGSVRSREAAFEMATSDQWTEIRALKDRLDPLMVSEDATRRDTGAYLFGTYCRSAGFYDEAILQLETLVARHPERKELHEELGSLYQAVGRNDKAAQEYRLALQD